MTRIQGAGTGSPPVRCGGQWSATTPVDSAPLSLHSRVRALLIDCAPDAVALLGRRANGTPSFQFPRDAAEY